MSGLIAEDDRELSEILSYVLRRAGFDVICAHDGMHALRAWKTNEPSLVLLDLDLPRMDGWEVCRQIRMVSQTPIVMLTGQRSDEQVVQGLSSGADDYITKPFSPAQLLARIEAVLRRAHSAVPEQRAPMMRAGDLELDLQLHAVRVDGKVIPLTRLEFRLLHALALRAGYVVSHRDLIQRVWGYSGGANGPILKSHIRNLRRKIEQDPSAPRYLHTVATVGYRLAAEREEDLRVS
jgi:DNA-binding response OmpR family regulator